MTSNNTKKQIKLEDIKIVFDQKNLPAYLSPDLKEYVNQHYDFLRNRVSFIKEVLAEKPPRRGNWINDYDKYVSQFNFINNTLFDHRMKTVWKKLDKINPSASKDLFAIFLSNNFEKDAVIDTNYNAESNKISNVRKGLKLCLDLVDDLDQVDYSYASYNPSAPKSNSRLWLHGDVTDALYYGLKTYIKGLKKIINHYEKHNDVFNRLDYMRNPASRKTSIKNFQAIYCARLIKIHFLKNYQKPMNKEIGIILDIIFGDESDVVYDADYVAKITKDADKTYKEAKKMEDSPDIYNYKPSF
jgi:hypothetical protein